MCVFIRHQIHQPLRQSTTDTMASSVSMMHSGSKIFTTMPDILFIPEFVCGGLVWTLVASTKVEPANPQGWVMFVSLFCFLITTLWFLIFITGINQSSIWPSLNVGYHAFSAFFYLSAAVLLANVTIIKQEVDKVYQLDIAAVSCSWRAGTRMFGADSSSQIVPHVFTCSCFKIVWYGGPHPLCALRQ